MPSPDIAHCVCHTSVLLEQNKYKNVCAELVSAFFLAMSLTKVITKILTGIRIFTKTG